MIPSNQKSSPSDLLSTVLRLAYDRATFAMTPGALEDALGFGLDDDDVREVFAEAEQWTFIKTMPTRHQYPGTMSDVYVGYVEDCGVRMYIKFVIAGGVLVVTSFKEDEQ